MAYGFTLHNVRMGGKVIPPSKVAEFDERDFLDLEKVGAVRTPTERELQAYGLSTAEPVKSTQGPEQDARDALEEEAKSLGVKFNKNLSDEKLRERIEEARAAQTEGDEDPEVEDLTS